MNALSGYRSPFRLQPTVDQGDVMQKLETRYVTRRAKLATGVLKLLNGRELRLDVLSE